MKAEALRKSILQYAIQGKLVPQIETEEPARVLLEKIKAEKQELIKQGKIKKAKQFPVVLEEIPFDIPDSWQWARFDDVAILFSGNSINAQEKRRKYTNKLEGYNYIATKDIRFDNFVDYDNGIKIPFDTTFRIAKANSSLLCIEGGSAGRKVGMINQDVCFGNKLCSFETIKINPSYLFYYLQAPSFTENFKGNKSGMIGGVGVNTLKTLCVAIPPFEEQRRIIAGIEELMALVDDYEKKEIELSQLEKEFPEKIKKSILQYAIQGKLVSQIENEEPANILLEKIKLEKQELIKQGKIKKSKLLSEIKDDEKPFDIPNTWEWCKINDLLLQLPKNGLSPNGVDKETNTKVLTLSATTKGILDLNQFKYVKDGIAEDSYLWLHKNDILVQRSNSLEYVGISCIYDSKETGYIYPDLIMKLQTVSNVDTKYIFRVLHSPLIREYFRQNASGTSDTMKKITQGIVANAIVPLPPLAEQKRIVARIEELFGLIDCMDHNKKIKQSKADKKEIETIANVIDLSIKENKNKFDVQSLKLVARAESGLDEEAVASALKQVQEFYDKKN